MKKHFFLCLFALATTLSLSAQSNCLIGLHGGVTNSPFVTPGGAISGNERLSFYGLTLGASLRQDFKEKFYWQAGLQYAQLGERLLTTDNLRWPSENDGNGGYLPDPSLPHRLEQLQQTDYLSLRAGAGYYLWRSEKFGLGLMPFAEANFFMANKDEQQFFYDDGSLAYSSPYDPIERPEFRSVNVSAGLALSFQAKIGSKFDLFLSPDAAYQLQSATVDNGGFSDTRRYFAMSLNAGVFYRL